MRYAVCAYLTLNQFIQFPLARSLTLSFPTTFSLLFCMWFYWNVLLLWCLSRSKAAFSWSKFPQQSKTDVRMIHSVNEKHLTTIIYLMHSATSNWIPGIIVKYVTWSCNTEGGNYYGVNFELQAPTSGNNINFHLNCFIKGTQNYPLTTCRLKVLIKRIVCANVELYANCN